MSLVYKKINFKKKLFGMYIFTGDTVFTKLSQAHGHLFMGDMVSPKKTYQKKIYIST